MPDTDWTNVNIGRLQKTQAANIVRELKGALSRLDNVYPQGDRTRRAQYRVTLDRTGCYHIYLNRMAILCLLLYLKDVPHPFLKQDDTCPDDVPDFMRWESHENSGSIPG